jgi:hypothetical protein
MIAALNRQVEMLTARLSRLEADNGALRVENAALCRASIEVIAATCPSRRHACSQQRTAVSARAS